MLMANRMRLLDAISHRRDGGDCEVVGWLALTEAAQQLPTYLNLLLSFSHSQSIKLEIGMSSQVECCFFSS